MCNGGREQGRGLFFNLSIYTVKKKKVEGEACRGDFQVRSVSEAWLIYCCVRCCTDTFGYQPSQIK